MGSIRRWGVAAVGLLVLAVMMTACGDGPGSRGNIFVMVSTDSTIASVDATDLDLPSNPDELVGYQAATKTRRVTWTTTGAVDYEAYVKFNANPGEPEEQECTLVIFCIPRRGEDGEDRSFILEFSNGIMIVSEIADRRVGTAY